VTLTSQEMLVLQTVLLQARHSIEQIAKQTGIRHHVVRRIVQRLEEQKVLIGVRAYVNAYPLGLQEYQVFFSLPKASAEKQHKIITHLCRIDGVSLLSELGGHSQYEMHFLARDSREAIALLDSLQGLACEIQLESLSLTHEQYYSGALGYLLRDCPEHKPLRFGSISKAITVDSIDHTLLSHLANDSIDSHRTLSQKLKIPTTTLSYRIQMLESQGLIAGYYHLCDFKPLGFLPVVAFLYTSALNAETRSRLIDFCNKHPLIAYVDLTVGPFSARVFLRARTYEDARLAMSELNESFLNQIQSIRFMPQLRFFRHSTYPYRAG
jgi:DNA-binding Lrp family transcriptional regulator